MNNIRCGCSLRLRVTRGRRSHLQLGDAVDAAAESPAGAGGLAEFVAALLRPRQSRR